ncbi:MAG: pilin [Patescibacteria group bacterium]|nr:pilin [Patescibacteria group bacterium]MDD4466210.1 pilin [Patescibacteria group bacterium]
MKNKLTLFLLSLIFLSVATANVASGSEKNFTFTPQVGIPDSNFQTDKQIPIGEEKNGTTSSTLLADYITSFYTYALNILGVLAVLILMAGGVQWIISGGNTKKIESAKKMIGGSIFGGALLIGSYLILNTINPDLTKLPAIEMPMIDKIETGCCDEALDDGTAKITNTKNCAEGKLLPNHAIGASGKCEGKMCCIQYTYQKDAVLSCTMKLASNCGPKKDSVNDSVVYEVGFMDCENLAICKEASYLNDDCKGIKDGERPKGPYGSNIWCYDEKIHSGYKAQIGERCGNNEGSLCFDIKFTKCNRDMGGRRCETGNCCEVHSDGTMKK